MITFLGNVKDLSLITILLASMIYRRQLKLTRWQRKLTVGEWTMYIMLSIALPFYAIYYLVFLLGT
ncbi:hypothetical protein U1P98_21125 [Lysinibacillus irui]|uniref:Uncharacterized protein n=1 Tax=Lysinibacillus irui TaxID=2998077 RepID=A0ABU5NS12_9BACI|nr:hypothetical protein [Lysinibacillus irui]MEA0553436.1 hypothetical protein [Lysinibacillus irui]MEA0978804.1 hypothetical protein [Lysinibacillus irui]MEA1044958.1 hypothetical protein [Lysinibacillus irui]